MVVPVTLMLQMHRSAPKCWVTEDKGWLLFFKMAETQRVPFLFSAE